MRRLVLVPVRAERTEKGEILRPFCIWGAYHCGVVTVCPYGGV